jgi:hypothetical protein
MRAATRAIGFEVDHETAYAAAVFGASGPVVVVCVVAASIVSLRPELFDEDKRFPALDATGAVFDAFCRMVSG